MLAVRRAFARAYAAAFTLMIAALAINSAANIILNPNRMVVSGLPGPLPYVWAVQYGLGGLMLAGGIMSGRLNLEAAGCVGFIGGALVNAVATAVALGWDAWNGVLLLILFVLATTSHLIQLVRQRVMVLPPGPPEA